MPNFKRMKNMAIALMGLNIIDMFSTIYAMTYLSVPEQNPIVVILMKNNAFLIVKGLLVTALIYFIIIYIEYNMRIDNIKGLQWKAVSVSLYIAVIVYFLTVIGNLLVVIGVVKA